MSKNQYFNSLLKLKRSLPASPRRKAKANIFLDPILTNFPSFKLNADLGPGRVCHKLSSGLGFI